MNLWDNEILINQQDKEPKDIFDAYCDELGRHYLEKNFKYFKSKPGIERITDDIVESINFWSSKVNVKNECVHLEILPYIKSKALKKWIKLNQIGRNEFIYSLKVDYPRNIEIFGHGHGDFEKLTKQIDIRIISKLEEFKEAVLDLRLILETNKFDEGIIKDNFLAFVCMKNPELIENALEKYGNKLSEELRNKIIEKKAG